MEDFLKQAVEEQTALFENARNKQNELCDAYLDSIRHPWKGAVSNIKEAVSAIRDMNATEQDDE